MTVPGDGEFRQSNEALLHAVDVSARASDLELQVVMAKDRPAELAALVFSLCEQAERLNPHIARILDEEGGHPMTNRGHVLKPIMRGKDMQLRPLGRDFLVLDSIYDFRLNMEHLFGRPIETRDKRNGVSFQLTNRCTDALAGHRDATDQEKTKIRGYTRRIFAEVLNDVDLAAEVDTFSAMV